MNTISAAFLTFLKGSGLPNRFKYYQDELSKLRWQIEQRERDFWMGNGKVMDPLEEVAIIEQMFERIQVDIESSTPDRFLSASKQNPPNGPLDYPSAMGRGVSRRASQFESDSRGAVDQMERRIMATRQGLESRATDLKQDVEKQANDMKRGVEKGTTDMVQEAENRLHSVTESIEQRSHATVRQAEGRVNDTSHKVEERAKESESKMLEVAEKAAEKVFGMLKDRRSTD